jgi:4-hydroxy-tetrahydrodipicolinate synthase
MMIFFSKEKQTANEKLCNVRIEFEKFNLISGLHSYLSTKNKIYRNILPPLSLLNESDEKSLIHSLEKLNFSINPSIVV